MRGAIGVGADARQGDLELHAVVPADAAVGDRDDAGGFHRRGQLVELGPCRRRLGRADLGHRRARQEDRVDAIDLHRQRDPVALRLVQSDQFGGDQLFVAGGRNLRIEVDGRRDLAPRGDLRSFELRGGGRIAGDDVGAQLVHHLGGEAGHRAVLPDAAFLLEPLAKPGDRRTVAAGRPLRDERHARLGLRPGHCRDAGHRGHAGGAGQEIAPSCEHSVLPRNHEDHV